MAEEVKIPNGGLNKDDGADYLSRTEYSDSRNYRPIGTEQEDAGFGTNLVGTTLIDGNLPNGLNAVIGNGVFKNIRKAYTIVYNSNGNHLLQEMDYDTLVVTTLFTDLLDTGGVQIFNILPNHYFNDVKLYHEKYLVMTDGISGMIYCINLDRLKSGGYLSPIIKDDFNLLKAQPLKPIKAEYISDEEKTANLLKGKLFQFRYQNEYFDLMKSSWGTISKRPVPEEESTDDIGDDPRKLNGIILKVNIGDERVQKINIASRTENFDWYLIKSVTRAYVLALPTAIDFDNEIREAYNPTTNEYSFIFYNDRAPDAISPLDTDEPYDAVPRNAGTLEIVNGDILALGDLDEGYDRPVGLDVQVTVSVYQPELNTSIEDPRNFSLDAVNVAPSSWNHRRKVELNFHGIPKTGDVIKVVVDQLFGRPSTPQEFTHVVSGAENNNLELFTTNFLNELPNEVVVENNGTRTKFKERTGPDTIRVVFITQPYFEMKSTSILFNQTGDVVGLTKNIVKSNSSYQLALFHYDKEGRYFPIVTGDNFVANTPSYAISEGMIPQIGWQVLGTPPVGAVSYQWGISENTKYLNTLYITGMYDTEESGDDFIFIDLFSLDGYMKNSVSGVVSYDYAEGDRVTFINNFNSTSQPLKWFNSPAIDFPVAGFEIKVTEGGRTKYLLKIKKSTILDMADLTGKELLLEVYSPKKNNESIETKIFYEIGEQFDIIDGTYSVTSGVIKEADAYLKPRKFRSNVPDSNEVYAFSVEDFNFSDDYVSNYWSAGRGRTYNDEVGKVRRKASIRFGDSSSIGSLNNNINRFYASRIYGEEPAQTTSIYGAITKLIMRDNYLIALQELKVGHIPVNISILEDQAEQQNVAISANLFNNVRYLAGNIGTGLAKRAICVSNVGNVYFIDHNNGYPCRDGYDGLSVINNKMSKYFTSRIKGIDPKEMTLIFDDFNNELNLVFIDLSGQIEVISFGTQQWEYRDSYVKTLADVTLIQPDNGTATQQGSDILYTPDNGFSGTDSVSITFTDGGTVILKNACINVVEGTSSVNPFSFIALVDQPVSTLLISNSIFPYGNNIAVPISIVGGQYRINDGFWTSTAGLVNQGDKVEVRQTSSASNATTTTATLTISDQSAPFNVTTISIPPDPNPNPYTFATITGANLNLDYDSEVAYINGINVSIPISVDSGMYSINGGAFTNASGTVVNGDYIVLQMITANTYNTSKTMTVTTGSYSTTFTTVTEIEEVGNTEQSQSFQRNNCASGSSGTFYNYVVPANTYFAPTLTEANNEALADITANGQNTANLNGSCILNTVISTFVVDIDSNPSLISSFYIDTAGVTESGTVVASGQNFFPYGTPAESNYMLASDLIVGEGTTDWRYEASIGKLINLYPDTTAFPSFTYRLRGHGTVAGTLSGTYALKFPNQKMIMLGDEGEYIPSVTPAGGPAVINWSGPLTTTPNTVIATFTYNRGTNTITVS